MKSRRPWTWCRAFWMLLAVVLLVPSLALAQTETGRISGTAMDEQGGVLPGATVTATNTGTGAVRTAVTDDQGRYTFTNLQPGTYEVSAELSGFAKNSGTVIVPVGAAMEFNPKLGIAGTAETIQVVSETPVINTLNAEQSTTVSEAQIRELPTLTRNVYDLVGVSGNVASDPESNRGTGYAINGMRSASTNVLLDGSANNDEFSASVGQAVPLDSVQEFSVITNNFSAQYGRATGGIVNVATKSGTNTFRGTVYEFFRNEKLSANTPDNNSSGIEKGKYRRDQSGFSLGGPVVKDKLHFFTSLEYIRVRSKDTEISWVPTPQFLAAAGPATQAFFNAYGKGSNINGPVLTRADVSAIVDPNGTGAGAFSNLPEDLPVFGQVQKSLSRDAGGGDPQDNYQWVSRADYSVGANSQLYVRYAYQNQEAQPGTNASSPYEGFDTGYVNHNHNLLGSFTHVFSPTFTAQSKVVWNRLYGDQPLNGDPLPTLYMNPTSAPRLQTYRIAFPGYLPWSPGSAIPFGGPQKLLQLYQDQTWIKGSHDVRFGGSYVHIADDRTFAAYLNAVEALNTSSRVLPSLDNFVLGQLGQFQAAINPHGYPLVDTYTTPAELPSFFSANRYNEFALYANDNWRLGNRLTINLGLRYEYYGPQTKSDPKHDSNFYYGANDASVNTLGPVEMINQLRAGRVYPSNESPIGNLWKPDKNNWAPRLGFAWDLRGDGKTSVRGGYGLSYERNFGNVTYNVLFNPPEYAVGSIFAADLPGGLPIDVNPTGPFGGVAGVTKPVPTSSLRHIDQNIETAYAHFWGLSYQHEIAANLVAKAEYSGSLGRKLYDLADPNKRGAPLVYLGVGGELERANTQYTAFNTRGNRGRSEYNGIQLSLESRRVGKTGLQFSGSYTYGRAYDNLSSTFSDSGNNFNLGYLDAFDPMLDWGYAQFDIRHRASISGIWQIPFFREASGLQRAVLGDWQVAFLANMRTGFPFTIYDCTNGFALCMRMEDPVGISRDAVDGPSTANANEFKLLDLTPLLPSAGGYVHPVQGTSDFGPYPSDMTKRDAFRGPGYWNIDATLSKRIRFADRYAVQFRFEAYNMLNHPNMYVDSGNADISSFDAVYGYRGNRTTPDQRRMQFGLKFEF